MALVMSLLHYSDQNFDQTSAMSSKHFYNPWYSFELILQDAPYICEDPLNIKMILLMIISCNSLVDELKQSEKE